MFITFNTPGTLTAQGWLANFSTTVNPFCGSSTTITYPVGTINDGSGRFNYRNISNCKWKITPTGVTKVVLTVNNFKTEEGKDKVMVYDLGTSALLATWSGNYTTMPAPITSATGGVMIVWGSNNSGRDEGWDISFSPMVGVTTPESFENLTVYPNPAHEILNIEFNSPKVQNVNLSLATITGNNITTDLFRSVSGNFKTTLDISGLPRGIYLLNLRSEQGNSVQKIVIQ
jgi:hypothetical protein